MNSLYKILTIIFLLGTTISFAQEVASDVEIPAYNDRDDGELTFSSGNQFPDFQATDLDGNSHHLQQYLDDGYTVVLNFFTYYCQPCQDAGPTLDHFYQNYDYNYELVKVIGFETTSFNQQNVNEISIPNIVSEWGIDYPVINSDDLMVQFNSSIEVFPTYVVICPDGTYDLEEGYGSGATLPFLTQNALECLGTDVDDDIDVIDIESQRCEESITLNVQFQNTGTSNINNFDYIVFINDSPIDTVNYVCSLSEGDILITTSTYDEVPDGDVEVRVEANLTYQEDNLYNNELESTLEPMNELDPLDSNINLTVIGDNFLEETAWKLRTIDGEVIAEAGFDSTETIIGLSNTYYSQNLSLEPNTCYTFEIFDTYGDGICCGVNQGYGSFVIQGLFSNDVIVQGGEFSYIDQYTFYLPGEIGLEEMNFQNKIVSSEVYYDFLGRQLKQPESGVLLLRKRTFEDGSSHTEKIILE